MLNSKDNKILSVLKVILKNEGFIRNKPKYASCVNFSRKVKFIFTTGICGNIWSNCDYNHDIHESYLQSWDKYSGDVRYPVPNTGKNEDPALKWEGDGLELRLELIRHLIKCYEKEM